MNKKKYTSYQYKEGHEKEILAKLERYCAYTERCESDVIKKLKEWDVPEELYEKAISYLKENKYIQEERYGMMFASGKFRLKGWGKQKIKHKLQEKKIDEDIIESSLEQIDEEEYLNRLDHLLTQKGKKIQAEDTYVLRGKLYKYACGKGYEPNLIIHWLDKNI